MKSLFDAKFSAEIVGRINKLEAVTPALWGKMNVSQMLAHCQVPLQMAMGQMQLKGNPIIRFLFGRAARAKLLSDEGFKKNLPTFREAVVTDEKEFEKEKQKLIELVTAFQKGGEAGITHGAHPFFGELSVAEWDALQAKHPDHHLSQFGV